MGVADRKEREKEQRRNSILDAAEKVFFSKGVENSKMDDVAEEAELSKGTLYLYFNNKNDLFHGIIARAMECLFGYFKNAIASQTRGLDQIKAVGYAYFNFYQEKPNYFSALIHHDILEITEDLFKDNPNMTLCSQIAEKMFGMLHEVVDLGIIDGSIREDIEKEKVPLLLWGLSAGSLHIFKSKEPVIKKMYNLTVYELWKYSFDMMISLLEKKK